MGGSNSGKKPIGEKERKTFTEKDEDGWGRWGGVEGDGEGRASEEFFPTLTRLFLPSSGMRGRLYVMGRMQSLRKSPSGSSLTAEAFFIEQPQLCCCRGRHKQWSKHPLHFYSCVWDVDGRLSPIYFVIIKTLHFSINSPFISLFRLFPQEADDSDCLCRWEEVTGVIWIDAGCGAWEVRVTNFMWEWNFFGVIWWAVSPLLVLVTSRWWSGRGRTAPLCCSVLHTTFIFSHAGSEGQRCTNCPVQYMQLHEIMLLYCCAVKIITFYLSMI